MLENKKFAISKGFLLPYECYDILIHYDIFVTSLGHLSELCAELLWVLLLVPLNKRMNLSGEFHTLFGI